MIFLGIHLIPLGGCAKTSFSGASSQNGDEASTTSEPRSEDHHSEGTIDPENDCNRPDEFITLKFPEPIESCISQGNHIFHFGGDNLGDDKCFAVDNLNSACTFDGMTESIRAHTGIRTNDLLDGKNKGAKLVACATKSGGKTQIAQWVFPQQDKIGCEYQQGQSLIVTGCYKLTDHPIQANTQEEIRRAVRDCLTET